VRTARVRNANLGVGGVACEPATCPEAVSRRRFPRLTALAAVVALSTTGSVSVAARGSSSSRTGGAAAAGATACTGVEVGAAANLPRAVAKHPAGTTFCIQKGRHRLTRSVDLKPHDRIVGRPGAILDGGRVLTRWSRSGRVWSVGGQTEEDHDSGRCAVGHPLCNDMNDVFFDRKRLTAVGSIDAVRPGTFFFDYPDDTIYIGRDPRGHDVEVAVAKGAFSGCDPSPCGRGLVITGLVMQHFYGSAVEISDGRVTWSDARFNHVAGIAVARDGVISHDSVHDNGLEGLGSTGDPPRRNLVVSHNNVGHNGYVGYDMGWESGGGKWVSVRGLTLRDNNVHGNHGLGFWIDTDNINVLIANNRIVDNAAGGIEYEASFAATIRDNTIVGNGFGLLAAGLDTTWFDGAGIAVAESPNVTIYGNTVLDDYHGIGAMQRVRPTPSKAGYGLHDMVDLHVHDNRIRTRHKAAGLVEVIYNLSYYSTKGNRFQHNTYMLGCTNRAPFAWRDPAGGDYYAYVTRKQWRDAGEDTTGRISPGC